MKNEIVKFGIILCLFSAIAAGALGYVNEITMPLIEEQKVLADTEARKQILPSAESFEAVKGDFGESIIEVYKGISGGQEVGYTIKSTSVGYGGHVEIVTGISVDGKVTGVTLGNMNETPGLGAKATEDSFKGQYSDKEASEFTVSKVATGQPNEIVAISGATITSKAVTKGVNESIEFFKTNFKK